MQDELNNFTRNQVWELVERPNNKWVYWNKQDEHGIVVKNKARLVAKGYSQVDGLVYGEPSLRWNVLKLSVPSLNMHLVIK
jgi:hypothetical protein